MTGVEIAINAGSLSAAVAGMLFVVWVVRTSGADRAQDPVRVKHLVETAPYERLDNVLAKQR